MALLHILSYASFVVRETRLEKLGAELASTEPAFTPRPI